MSYAIFRTQPIMTTQDLAQIGSHNNREKKAYESNPDIKLGLSKNNIDLVPCNKKYLTRFHEITKDYEQEYNERQKTIRKDRRKTFSQAINKSKSVVADELLFTATNEFFKNKSLDDIKSWANTCMDFVYKDLGYKKEQILHSVIHLDEKTPHIHCVVVPLIKKYDKRANKERYTISKKQYIKSNLHLSQLQDKYYERLTKNGFDLLRGIKGNDNVHIGIKDYKKITKKLNHELNMKTERLENAITNLNNNMKSNKATLFDKDYVKIKKETFNNMNIVINESKKVMEMQPKLQQVFNEIDSYNTSYQLLDKNNKSMEKEIEYLKDRNKKLENENKNLKDYISVIFKRIKTFFRKLLLLDNEETKNIATNEIKDHYSNKHFDKHDIIDIAKGTTKEDELYDHADIPSYLRTRRNHHKNRDDDFDLSL